MEKWEERVVGEFIQLTQVDSLSGKERLMADLLKNKLAEMGLQVWEDEAGKAVNGNAGNVLAKLPGTAAGTAMLLCAHMDTVEPGCGVRPQLADGIIRSAGDTVLGADDKAGIVTILEVLRWVLERGIEHAGLEVAFTIWEENGLKGAKYLDLSALEAKMGYVLDSTGLPGAVITNAPSHEEIHAIIRGQAAHAGICPEAGVSAIQIAAHAVAGMELGRIDDETTCNIGIISGGKANNIVPDMVVLDGEARSLNAEKMALRTKEMCRAIETAAARFSGKAEITVETAYHGYNLTETDLPVLVAKEAAKALGLDFSLNKTGGGSDANVFNKKGLPTAVLGIGMKQVHTTEEYIRVEDLLNNVRYLYQIVQSARR